MIWIAPSGNDTIPSLEQHLWDAADQFRANSGLKSQEYSAGSPPGPVLGHILPRFAEVRFAAKRAQLESPSPLGGERAGVRAPRRARQLGTRAARSHPFIVVPVNIKVDVEALWSLI